MSALVSRAYNSFKIHPHFGLLTKSSDNQRIRDEINYYRALPAKLATFFPRLVDFSVTDATSWMTLEQYGYPNLGEFLIDAHSKVNWHSVFEELFVTLKHWATIDSEPGTRAYAEKMYLEKTVTEYQNLVKTLRYDLFSASEIQINGKQYLNFERAWPEIKSIVEKNLVPYVSSFFHGDCCFSNILFCESKNIFRFIDPRGSFGKVGIYGDLRYDVAKLYHSCNGGYEFFINDQFKLEMNSDGTYGITLPPHRAHCQEAFEKVFFPDFSKRDITLIEGLIYVGMAARHYDSESRQVAMYLTGVQLLNETLDL